MSFFSLKYTYVIKTLIFVVLCCTFYACMDDTEHKEVKKIQEETENEKKEQKENQQTKEKSKYTLENHFDSVSYCLGANIAGNLRANGIENIDLVAFATGVNDIMNNKVPVVRADKANNLVLLHLEKIFINQVASNIKEGDEFLAKNKTQMGVIELKSGLQYKIIKDGDGIVPDSDDIITLHYEGTFIDGTVFDSSVRKRKPLKTTYNDDFVIAGWNEVLKHMKPGAKWKLFVPPHLAYGSEGYKNIIPPYKTLVFTIEILSITKQ